MCRTEEKNSSTIMGVDFSTQFSIMDRAARQEIKGNTQLELHYISVATSTHTYKHIHHTYYHSTIAKYIFHPSAPKTFSRIDHILGHK